jgi:DNA-binding NarL/FixJ family response regulator
LTPSTIPAILQICRLLDGLPLAIELAAARSNVLSPEAMAVRLQRRLPLLTGGARDLPERQRTMRGTVAWSYDLLPPEEQQLFRRLSIFAGGFSLEAAELIGTSIDGIGSLVDKSLVRTTQSARGEVRFDLLETIREFALEQLQQSGEMEEVRAAHLAWGRTMTSELWRRYVQVAIDAEILNLHETEHDNLRSMLAWLEQQPDPAQFIDFASSLSPFWRYHNHYSEGRAWLDRARERMNGSPADAQARVHFSYGLLALYQSDWPQATHALEESLRLWRELGDGWGVSTSQLCLAVIARANRDLERASTLLEEAMAGYRAIGSPHWAAVTLRHLGEVTYALGDLPRANEWLQSALTVQRGLDDEMGLATVLDAVGLIEGERGEIAGAGARYLESLPLWQSMGSKEGISDWLRRVAVLAEHRRLYPEAARIFASAHALATKIGHTARPPERDAFETSSARVDAALGSRAIAALAGQPDVVEFEAAIEIARELLSGLGSYPPPAPVELPGGLSEREAEVLRFVAAGLTNIEIAERLYLSPNTVRAHLHRIYGKLEVTNRAEAVRFALDHNLR